MEIIGLFGHPVGHSLSKIMHTSALKTLNMDWEYKLFDIHPTKLEVAVEGIRLFGLRGVNVTVPHKTAVMSYLDHITDTARLCGAVNTVINEQGKLRGDNTDFGGFISALSHHKFLVQDKQILVLGAGGSARAVVAALSSLGAAHIYIVNRTFAKAIALAKEFPQATALDWSIPDIQHYLNSVDAVINTTSLGMYPRVEENPLQGIKLIPSKVFVFDLIYNPWQTSLLRLAKNNGCKIANGAEMLVGQGALSFELWTGMDAPIDIMRNALTTLEEKK